MRAGGVMNCRACAQFQVWAKLLWPGDIRGCSLRERSVPPVCAESTRSFLQRWEQGGIIVSMSTPKVPKAGESVPRTRRTPEDLWAFARAWTVLLAADIGLRALPFARVDRWLTPALAPGRDEPAVGRLVWATEAAARHHLYPMRCLPKSLCLRWLLGRHGLDSELRIGVARPDGGLAAHAWVERQGRPVGEALGVEERFSPLRPI
jgi:Transglutaminase-like superfamily